MKMTKTLSVLMTGLMACAVQAADYYVSTEGNDANDGLSPEKAVKTLDKAFDLGGGTAGNRIYVKPGTYTTDKQYGFDLQADLIGDAETRDAVVIQSAGNYRTLRMNATANPTVTNLTLVGCADITKVDKGGTVEMNGGRIVDCVIRDGKANAASDNLSGGNLYVTGNGLVENCLIQGGEAKSRGGNVHLLAGTIRNCIIKDGSINGSGIAGNIFLNNANARVEGCTVSGGIVDSRGGNIFMLAGKVVDSIIENGVCTTASDQYHGGANVFLQGGCVSRCVVTGGSITSGNERGGAFAVGNGDAVRTIEDTLICGNTQGAIYCFTRLLDVYNCTIVSNKGYGGYGYGNQVRNLVNCVVYNNTNEAGGMKEWAGNRPATMSRVASNDTGFSDRLAVADDDFEDFSNANYRLRETSALIDKGMDDSREDASALDLDRKPRISKTVDIGCYEYQHQDMTVSIRFSAPLAHRYAPVEAAFEAEVAHASEDVTFVYDFGDGTVTERISDTRVSHTYEEPGAYTVKVTAYAGEETATYERPNYVDLVSKIQYVTTGTTPVFPYDTPATGHTTLAAALAAAVDGCEIRVSDGIYEQTTRIVVDKEITISGNNANPEAVVLRNTAQAESGSGDHRVMSIDNAAVVVSGITLEGGQVFKGNGGNLIISAGMISNCVIRSGLALADADGEYAMGGGVALSGSGLVTHCVISNNEVRGSASGKWVQGGAVVFPWGSAGKLRHSLIAGNRWTVENETANGTAGIVYHSSTSGSVVENCTVVDNKIVGTCEASSKAGIHCVWDSIVRNTVIAGNRKGEDVSNVYLAKDGSTWKDGLNTCVTEDALPSGNASCWTATLDKMFRNYSAGDYRPKVGGALFNRGAVFPDVPLFDLMGVKRVFDTADRLATGTARIDVGCYESQALLGLSIIIR